MKCSEQWLIIIIRVAYVQKGFLDCTLIKQLFTKYQFLIELPQISYTHKNRNF